MSDKWTVETYAAHNEALRLADLRFNDERDRRYSERFEANKAALAVALSTATKADEKTEQALKEYKTGANEWRDTVKDIIALQQGGSKGMRDVWGWVMAAAVVGSALWDKLG